MAFITKKEFVDHEKWRLWDAEDVLNYLDRSADIDVFNKFKRDKFKHVKIIKEPKKGK